ncbi:MAG TPA: glycosyltransferase family 4 protein, partial [Candidatus Polarisedimenticolia bacterium]|nr:glycosyltransferase family 4 protein [Candidatus Polarisedimenticolia bacterium]
GPDRLVEAAVLLAERGVEFRLEIVGEGAMRSGLESRILAGGARLAERVRLTGRADEDGVLAVLRRAAVFVLPSRTEAAPVALMEAMSCGLACVASDVGGVGAMLDGGRCGVLVPAGDPQAMAGAIAGLLADPARRRTLGAAARDRALRHYRLEAAADALAAVWSRAVEEARAR